MAEAQDYSISQLTEDVSAADSDLIEVAKDNGNGTFSSRKQTRETLLTGTASQADLDAHEADTANPHQVTAAQVGAPTTAELSSHTANTSNPHSVTKAHVGLSNVDNTSDAAKPVSTATQTALDGKANTSHTHDDRYFTEAEVTTALSGKSDTGHTHDDRYYTETETDTLLNTKADASDVPATIVESVVAGTNVTVDNTDPANPVVSATGGGEGGGDMTAAVYDPNSTQDDAFDMDNMAESATSKVFTATERTKLAGIEAGAQANDVSSADIADFETSTELNARDSANRDRANHTGTQTASTISDFDTEVSNNTDVAANTADRHTHANSAVLDATTASFTTADETKLDGIEAGAEVNVSEINDAATTTTNTWSADKISTEIAAGGSGGGGGGSVDINNLNVYSHIQDTGMANYVTALGGTVTQDTGFIATVSSAETSSRVTITTKQSPIDYKGLFDKRIKAKAVWRKVPNRNAHFVLRLGSSSASTTIGNSEGFGIGNDGSGNLVFFTCSGSGNTQTDISAYYAADSFSVKDLSFEFEPGTHVKFYIDDTLIATHSTNLPSGDSFQNSGLFGLYLASNGIDTAANFGIISMITETL